MIAVFAAVLAPLWQRRTECRFWALGAFLALPPMCATFPMDRLLVFAGVGAMGQQLDAAIPRDNGVRERTLVLLSSSAEMTTFPSWMQRQVEQVPRPRPMRVLATCFGDINVSRLDARSLRVQPENGFLDNDSLRLVRGPSRPFRAGDEVQLSGLHVRVREVTPDGRPAVADFTFSVPLEDPSLMWRRIRAGGTLDPWSPPAVGETQRLPAIERRPASAAP